VDVEAGTILGPRTLDYRRAPDFPIVDRTQSGKAYEDFWMLGISKAGRPGRKFFDELVHMSWTTTDGVDIFRAPSGHYFAGEPVFIPRHEGDGSGYVICPWFDAETVSTSFALFDARHVGAGPMARIRLEHPIPPLFHATYL
jgi:carotenoid cleavage dioxygenase